MGPYCRFCDRRCFIPLPANTPPEALDAYGTSTIVATCPAGQAFELNRTGWNLGRIRATPTPAAAASAAAGEAKPRRFKHRDGDWDYVVEVRGDAVYFVNDDDTEEKSQHITVEAVLRFFRKGAWVEVPARQDAAAEKETKL